MLCDVCGERPSTIRTSNKESTNNRMTLYLCAKCASERPDVLALSDDLAEKANSFGESSYGATTVTLVLCDGRKVPHVVLAWSQDIVKIGKRQITSTNQLDFKLSAVVDVLQES